LIKKIYFLGSAGVPARYGGFETFAENISQKLAGSYEITVICSRKIYGRDERKPDWKRVTRLFLPIHANGLQSLLYDTFSLNIACRRADLIVLLGSGAGAFLPFYRKRHREKIWLHVDGLEWNRTKWNFIIKAFLRLSFKTGIRYAGKIIIDNKALKRHIPHKYHKKIVFSGYGGDHLPGLRNTASPLSESFALVIARAEPENNLELILKSFISLKDMHLVIISNWHQTALGRKLLQKYSGLQSISLIGPIYNDPLKLHTFRMNSSLYIHGHSAGGTNPSLVEALYSGLPVFAFDNEFNRETTQNMTYYFRSEEELTMLLKKRKVLDLRGTASKLKEYAQKYYTWDHAADIFLKFQQMNKQE
jgi:glycosyltransferase involved in cell wall biosynthesis